MARSQPNSSPFLQSTNAEGDRREAVVEGPASVSERYALRPSVSPPGCHLPMAPPRGGSKRPLTTTVSDIRGKMANIFTAHRADLEAHRPFSNLITSSHDAQGRLRHLALSGEPKFDGDGVFQGYWGVGRDVTTTSDTCDVMPTTWA